MTAPIRVLIVDDDAEFRDALTSRISLYDEFTPRSAASGAEALAATKDEKFGLIILDIGLPDIDGRETCRAMRRQGVSAPIIMLTGAATDSETILGLDAGADDYVTKPVSMEILVARMRAQIR